MAEKKKATKKVAKSEGKVVKVGDGYRADVADSSGKVVMQSMTFPTKKQAEEVMKLLLAKL